VRHLIPSPLRLIPWIGPSLLALILCAPALPQQAPAPEGPPIPPPLTVARATGPITLDGSLDDPAWQSAAVIDQFFETFPADNTEPPARTVAYLAYDDRYFYIGIHAFDPHPEAIRAPYVARDAVIGTDDNVAVFLDTRNDRRSALELRVNPRGDQGDAIYDDGSGNEDFSPDVFYDTAAKLVSDGWTAEYRIPFSSLRYTKPAGGEVEWGILIWRNYPRDQRYQIHSSPIPRGGNCWICRSREINGLTDLPAGGHYVAAPYATGRRVDEPEGELGSPLGDSSNNFDVGGDFKWTPTASNALDATINPDFSQIESDAGQIPTNNQFALFFPEKRPFFLEGLDLFDTPIQAVYTRTINDPRWGVRDTGKQGAYSYTALVAQDRGGGGVILPGPTSSGIGFEDFGSKDVIGRLRRDFGASYAGLLLTARQIDDGDGGGYNRVFGPDFNYRWSDTDQLTGQLLFSKTETPKRPDLAAEWDGRDLSSHAGMLEWLHTGRDWTWRLTGRDYGDDFRADLGFLPQVGIRLGRFAIYRNYYPKGRIRRAQPYLVLRHIETQDGREAERLTIPGVQVMGTHNLFANFEVHAKERRLVRGRLLEYSYVTSNVEIDPNRRISRVGYFVQLGEGLDFRGARKGRGGDLYLFGTIKPTDHLALEFTAERQWLDLDDHGREGRLFTAQIERLKATYNFNARSFVRLIGEYFDQDSDPALYAPVAARRHVGDFNGSALFAYRLDWQTVFFLGYGDDRTQDRGGQLQKVDRAYFVKISYAFQG
jgi:hypothetical protein